MESVRFWLDDAAFAGWVAVEVDKVADFEGSGGLLDMWCIKDIR